MKNKGTESGFHFMEEYLRCQKYFWWHRIKRLEPKYPSPKLLFGINIHEALETRYNSIKEGKSTNEVVADTLIAFKTAMEESRTDYYSDETYDADVDRGIILLTDYSSYYTNEIVDVIDTERVYDFKEEGFLLTGRLDLVGKINDCRYIIDHKTTGWSMNKLTESLQITNQSCAYILLHNTAHPDNPVDTVVYNILRQCKSVVEFKRVLVTKTAEDVKRFYDSAKSLMEEISEKIVSRNWPWHMNTLACNLFNTPCIYMPLCMGSNFESLMDTAFRKEETNDRGFRGVN